MSVNVPGFKSSAVFEQIKAGLGSAPARQEAMKKANAVFVFEVKNAQGKEQAWTLDLKNAGSVTLGTPSGKADITILISDDTFVDLAQGKVNGQRLFMSGKIKIKGNMMLATRLDSILKTSGPAAASAAAAAPAPAAAAAPAAAPAAAVAGFECAAIFDQIKQRLAAAPAAEKEATLKKVRGIFQFDVKNKEGKVQTWTLDLKDKAELIVGTGPKPDITIAVGDKEFIDLAQGKANGQRMFMSGKIKIKGALMLATKLDAVLKDLGPKAKL
ncbi:hypothetical protein HK105_201454 [Polyrhizophydium stewartii]|uniref:SCP2 domain-containing protein n=1 Tax=Polyrhizophydium stewartii TaxID=2732419 RepID=A0ABR4NI21_9FUNG